MNHKITKEYIAIIGIIFLETLAIINGINGIALSATIAVLAGIAGFKIGKKK